MNNTDRDMPAEVVSKWVHADCGVELSDLTVTDRYRELTERLTGAVTERCSSESAFFSFLLYGMPGSGKSVISRIVISELLKQGYTFMELTVCDFGSLYLGEDARKLHIFFREAKKREPVVILFDEVELFMRRTGDALMKELSALRKEGRKICFIGCTSYPQMVSMPIVKSMDMLIPVMLPDAEMRKTFFENKLKNIAVDGDLTFEKMAEMTEKRSFRTLNGICLDICQNIFKKACEKYTVKLPDGSIAYKDTDDAVCEALARHEFRLDAAEFEKILAKYPVFQHCDEYIRAYNDFENSIKAYNNFVNSFKDT